MTIEHTIGPHTTLLTNYSKVDKLQPAMLRTLVTVGADEILTVTADAGSYGSVFQEGTGLQWSVGARAPLRLGPGVYRIETVKGNVSHEVSSSAVAVLAATLPTATEIVQSAAIIATAINKGRPVSAFADKFKLLAERVKEVPSALEKRIDPLFPRLDAAEAKGAVAANGLESHVTGLEVGVAAIEDVVNQLTNGAPADPK